MPLHQIPHAGFYLRCGIQASITRQLFPGLARAEAHQFTGFQRRSLDTGTPQLLTDIQI